MVWGFIWPLQNVVIAFINLCTLLENINLDPADLEFRVGRNVQLRRPTQTTLHRTLGYDDVQESGITIITNELQ